MLEGFHLCDVRSPQALSWSTSRLVDRDAVNAAASDLCLVRSDTARSNLGTMSVVNGSDGGLVHTLLRASCGKLQSPRAPATTLLGQLSILKESLLVMSMQISSKP